MSDTTKPACTQRHYNVTQRDLPLCCPMPNERVWDAHPRVYLPIEQSKEEVCPYCGARFTLIEEQTD